MARRYAMMSVCCLCYCVCMTFQCEMPKIWFFKKQNHIPHHEPKVRSGHISAHFSYWRQLVTVVIFVLAAYSLTFQEKMSIENRLFTANTITIGKTPDISGRNTALLSSCRQVYLFGVLISRLYSFSHFTARKTRLCNHGWTNVRCRIRAILYIL